MPDLSTTAPIIAPKEGKQPEVSVKQNKVVSGDPPYDGGHLVGFQFMGRDANVYDNVAPQGRALNNGPFQNWEKAVVVAAVKGTRDTLTRAGVAEENLPHMFDYTVAADYTSSKYDVVPDSLAATGLISSADVDRLPDKVSLTKRIPVGWRAYAQPLALPSAEVLGIKGRPDTPYMFAETRDYGAVDKENKERTNQEYMARGPKAMVDRIVNTTEAEYAFAEGIAKNKSSTSFTNLVVVAGDGR